MKLRNVSIRTVAVLLASMLGVTSCDYLDVVPPEQVTIDDAMETPTGVLGFLYSCYRFSLGSGGNENFADVPYGDNLNDLNASADDMLNPDTWAADRPTASSRYYNYGTLSPSACINIWHYDYSAIGQCYTFLEKLEEFKDRLFMREIVTQAEYDEYHAECKALIAYYHYLLLKRYGPIVILEGKPDMNLSPADMPGRMHVDYCADWIVKQLDEAAASLPAWRDTDTRGRMTSAMCKALKAKVLLLVASPLFNGSFPWPDFKNVNWETPGYGTELVSKTYDVEKYRAALQAADEAIRLAEGDGRRELYTGDRYLEEDPAIIDQLYVPGDDVTTEFKEAVLRMRYLHYAMEGEGNHEFIFHTDANATQTGLWQSAMPRNYMVLNNGQHASGYAGENPTLNLVLSFLTKDGYIPSNDPNFTDEADWYKSAGLPDDEEGARRENIINLCVGREPRFYAWVGFDGGDYGVKLANGKPVHINLRDHTATGYDRSQRNNPVTGFLSQKYQPPTMRVDANGSYVNFQWVARAVIRLAELYLIRAECNAVLGNTEDAMKDINVIRRRAGAAELTSAHLSKMPILDWVKAERMIEFAFEGKRLTDLIRWVEADQYLGAGKRKGLNADVQDPSFEEFNVPEPIPYNYVWAKRMYLYPIPENEVYSNNQIVQNPGY